MTERPLVERIDWSSPLGSGGLSKVYRVNEGIHGLETVAKVYPWVLRDYSLSEKRILETFLDQDNVVNIRGYEEATHEGKDLSIVEMDYVPGGMLDFTGRWDLKDFTKALGDIAGLLSYFEKIGFVYLDLKHENIIYQKGSSPGQGKTTLIDFNYASYKTEMVLRSRLGGTFNYFSPEQARNFETSDTSKVTAKTSIFSLGLTAYESLSGKQPRFGGVSNFLIQAKKFDEEVRDEFKRDLFSMRFPKKLVEAVGELLHVKSEDRQLMPFITVCYQIAAGRVLE